MAKDTFSDSLKWYEDTLSVLSKQILLEKSDQDKYLAHDKFRVLLKKCIALEGAFEYPFDSLYTVGILKSPDNVFRIFNWHIKHENTTFKYFAYILFHNKAQNKYYINELIDNSENIQNPEFARKVNMNNWFGAHYYAIVGKKKKNKSYVLLGWDGNYWNTQRKIIETISFNNKGVPKFGATKIKWSNRSKNRIILQYSTSVTATLRYEPKLKMIVFDHLVPPRPELTGIYHTYVPSGKYDGLTLKSNRWIYAHDVDARAFNMRNRRNRNRPKKLKPQN